MQEVVDGPVVWLFRYHDAVLLAHRLITIKVPPNLFGVADLDVCSVGTLAIEQATPDSQGELREKELVHLLGHALAELRSAASRSSVASFLRPFGRPPFLPLMRAASARVGFVSSITDLSLDVSAPADADQLE